MMTDPHFEKLWAFNFITALPVKINHRVTGVHHQHFEAVFPRLFFSKSNDRSSNVLSLVTGTNGHLPELYCYLILRSQYAASDDLAAFNTEIANLQALGQNPDQPVPPAA